MSWHFSQALVEDCLPATCLALERSALSNTTSMPSGYSCNAKTTSCSTPSRSGMTFERLTAGHGEELLTSYLEGFPARPSARPLLDATTLRTFGRRCGESWQMSLPGLSSPKTSRLKQSKWPPRISGLWVTKPKPFPYQRRTWVLTTFGSDTGYLHTPTTKANYCANSMQKWPAAREFTRVFGRPTPEVHEWLMGWPIGWTDIKPLEMDKWLSWLRSHSSCLQSSSPKEAA